MNRRTALKLLAWTPLIGPMVAKALSAPRPEVAEDFRLEGWSVVEHGGYPPKATRGELWVVLGPPMSGKTTLAARMAKIHPGLIVRSNPSAMSAKMLKECCLGLAYGGTILVELNVNCLKIHDSTTFSVHADSSILLKYADWVFTTTFEKGKWHCQTISDRTGEHPAAKYTFLYGGGIEVTPVPYAGDSQILFF